MKQDQFVLVALVQRIPQIIEHLEITLFNTRLFQRAGYRPGVEYRTYDFTKLERLSALICLELTDIERPAFDGDELVKLCDWLTWFRRLLDRQTTKVNLPAETRDDAESRRDAADDSSRSTMVSKQSDEQAAIRLLSVVTRGLSDERAITAGAILNENELTVDERLWKIDKLMPFPPSASAAKLGELFGVSKSAVQKTTWYIQKRLGRKDDEIAGRVERHRQRGQQHERDQQSDDD